MLLKIVRYSLLIILFLLLITLVNCVRLTISNWMAFFDNNSDYNLEIKSDEVFKTNLDLNVLKEEPVFYSSRQFYVQPISPSVVSDSFPALSYVGSIKVSSDSYIGIVFNQISNKSTKVKVGDVVDEWTVMSITGEKINLKKNNSNYEVIKSNNIRSIDNGLIPTGKLNAEAPPKYISPNIN
jgi:hypothetical protein